MFLFHLIFWFLGLAEKIELTTGRSIEYVFDAEGLKLRKTLKEVGKPDFVVDYMGELIYHNSKLTSIDTDEGRATPLDSTDTAFTYQFFYNDHLGNLRVAYGVAPNGAYITQENHFGPTGELLDGIGSNSETYPYLFQGKEREFAWGLDFDDFHSRQYDSYYTRMWQIDGAHQFASGYVGMGNNAVSMIDPDGRNPIMIGFMVGMFASSINHAINGTMPSGMGDFLRPGVTGAIGGYFSSFAPIGLLPGMGYGAVTGAITGGIDAAMSGGDIGQGIRGGTIAGSIFGGLNGAIEASALGADILTGQRGIRYSVQGGFNSYFKEDRLSYSDETLRNFNAANFPDVEGGSNMSMKFRPKQLRTEGDFFINENGDKVVAATLPRVWKHGKSASIFFSKHAFYSPEAMFLTMGHELGHVQHILANVQGAFSEIERHIPIHLWEANAALTNGWSKYSNSIVRTFGLSMTQPDPQLNILTIPFKLNRKF